MRLIPGRQPWLRTASHNDYIFKINRFSTHIPSKMGTCQFYAHWTKHRIKQDVTGIDIISISLLAYEKKKQHLCTKDEKRGLKRLPPNERKERKTYTKISMRSTTSAMVLILRVLLSRLDEFPLTFLSVHLSIDRWKTENKAWNVREALYIPFRQSSTLVDRCRDFRTVRHAFRNKRKRKKRRKPKIKRCFRRHWDFHGIIKLNVVFPVREKRADLFL